VRVDRPPPASLPAGSADAFYCAGACGEAAAEGLTVVVDGHRHPVWASGIPPGGLFWAVVPVHTPASPASLLVELEARAGRRAELGTIAVRAPETAPVTTARPAASDGDLIAVCMATFEPEPGLLRAQVQSLREQTDERWICLISDDGSSDESFERLAELIGDDRRFELSRSPERRGFYRNFERALRMVPADARLVALCDQDDRWHPDKLATLRAAISDAGLVYSDMRLVEADGTVLRDTLWRGRRNNHDDLTSMLVANSITGAAALFRRELLEVALPFPDTPGYQFHDAWLAVAALATGEVAYVERPLYDYVQHPGAVFGDVTHGRKRLGFHHPDVLRPVTWRAAYFHGYLSRAAQAAVLLARCGDRLEEAKRRALERFIACDRSPAALASLAARPLRELVGRSETLGSEFGLARGVAWKQVATAAAAHPVLARGPLADATVPGPEHFTQRRLRRWRSRV
jgi:hypothetical protein